MTKRKTPGTARAKARAVEQAHQQTRGGVAPAPAPTSLQREVDAKDVESARTRQQSRTFNKNLTVLKQPTPKDRIKVMATQTGYYDHIRRRPGDVFFIDGAGLEADVVVNGKVTRKKGDVAAFSTKWMEEVEDSTPESHSTANQHLRRQHDELLASRYQEGRLTGPDNVREDLPTGSHNPLGEDD